jgi:hypothetical protein
MGRRLWQVALAVLLLRAARAVAPEAAAAVEATEAGEATCGPSFYPPDAAHVAMYLLVAVVVAIAAGGGVGGALGLSIWVVVVVGIGSRRDSQLQCIPAVLNSLKDLEPCAHTLSPVPNHPTTRRPHAGAALPAAGPLWQHGGGGPLKLLHLCGVGRQRAGGSAAAQVGPRSGRERRRGSSSRSSGCSSFFAPASRRLSSPAGPSTPGTLSRTAPWLLGT